MSSKSIAPETGRPTGEFDLGRVRVYPLADRRSLTNADDILIPPEDPPQECPAPVSEYISDCADRIQTAVTKGASVMLIYGAHLLRNGAALILDRMMSRGWLTHLATNGAGSIHDWEYAYLGKSTESVEANVASGTFGTWDETGRMLHLAMAVGSLRPEGYGASVGRLVVEDGLILPSTDSLEEKLRKEPSNPLSPARAELLGMMRGHGIQSGRMHVEHGWKHASVLAQAFKHQVRMTVHPGIGYDIISNHPMFNGAVIGRAAGIDFQEFGISVNNLDGGVVLSVGSAIMGPQVFEKSLSCVNNLRIQAGAPIVSGHMIYVVDIQDGGNWDWRQGEPPKTNPAYYLRFCKSYSRMGGGMQYVNCDNLTFLHNLYHRLCGA